MSYKLYSLKFTWMMDVIRRCDLIKSTLDWLFNVCDFFWLQLQGVKSNCKSRGV